MFGKKIYYNIWTYSLSNLHIFLLHLQIRPRKDNIDKHLDHIDQATTNVALIRRNQLI